MNQFEPNLTKSILSQFQAVSIFRRSIYICDASLMSAIEIGNVVCLEEDLSLWLTIKNFLGFYTPLAWEVMHKGSDYLMLRRSNKLSIIGIKKSIWSRLPPMRGDTVTFKRPSAYAHKKETLNV